MKNRSVALLTALVAGFSLTGCGGDDVKPANVTPEQRKAEQEGMKAYMKDDKGKAEKK